MQSLQFPDFFSTVYYNGGKHNDFVDAKNDTSVPFVIHDNKHQKVISMKNKDSVI